MQNAEIIFFQPIVEKNRWLIRCRWVYPFAILLFFLFYRSATPIGSLLEPRILLLLLLPLAGNLVFRYDFERRAAKINVSTEYGKLLTYASIQLDFDLLVIFLSLFIPKFLESPLINLFFLYLILTPFLIGQSKALRKLLTAVLLVTIGLMAQQPDFVLRSQEITYLLTMIMLFFFAFFISSFLSRNLQKNEDLLQNLLRQTHELSISDGLTGLFNQTYFFEVMENETKISLRHNLNFSLIMLDVDYFKNYNDHNGHLHGSAALKNLGVIMKKVFRTTDFLAKYGGDEFVIVLPQTDKIGAYLAAERLREAVESEPFPGAAKQPTGRLTISLGLASFPEHGKTKEEIVEKSDKALYLAKSLGRNRTVIYHEGIEDEEEEY